jgi:hypothetical protein
MPAGHEKVIDGHVSCDNFGSIHDFGDLVVEFLIRCFVRRLFCCDRSHLLQR